MREERDVLISQINDDLIHQITQLKAERVEGAMGDENYNIDRAIKSLETASCLIEDAMGWILNG